MPGPGFHDEMDEYRERIEIQRGPDRRAPKIEPRVSLAEEAASHIPWVVIGFLLGFIAGRM